MTKIKVGDKVTQETATANPGKVRLGDQAPVFARAGDKVIRDTATVNPGNVHLGDQAPVFAPKK
jgi:hypothetical protein